VPQEALVLDQVATTLVVMEAVAAVSLLPRRLFRSP
jgi:hypothetical protein